MAEINRRWIYPTITASENKGIERIALSGEGLAHEVVGIDGSRKFGCRPSSGFQYAHTLQTLTTFADVADRPYSTQPPPTPAKTSTVTDCFPVHFQIRENEFGYGFVYRVKSGANAAIYMDFQPSLAVDGSLGWRTVLLSDHATDHVSPTTNMDVVSMGRYVMVFVRGRAPRVFYIEPDATYTTYSHKVVNGGPGQAPGEDTFSTGTQFANPALDYPRFRVATTTGIADAHQFESGDYSFAFYLHNSLTGRRTALSEVVGLEEGDITANDNIAVYFEADSTLYDQIYMFRSVRLQSVGGVYAGGILHLDGIYDLADLTKVDDDAAPYTADFNVYKAPYILSDISLAMQDIYLDRTIYDEEMPYAGSAVPFEGSLIVSDPDGPSDTVVSAGPLQTAISIGERGRNIGEVRWSSLTERSPELFPINNKYVPDVYQNRISKLVRTGEFAVGFSSDRLYHMRRNGVYLRIDDLHAGYGLAARDGVASMGPVIYFLTTKGLKSVANNGQLNDVQALDNLLLEDWYDDLADLRVGFDPYASCLFVLNPNQQQTVCMWFGTGRISEFHDVPFDDVRTGIWQKGWDNNAAVMPTFSSSTTMVERAFFVQNHPSTLTANIPNGWQPRVYILDFDRVKESNDADAIADGTATIRTLEYDGDVLFKVGGVSTASGVTTADILSDITTSKTLSSGSGYDLVGAYAYIVASSDASKVGTKTQIFSVSPGTAPPTLGVGGPTITFNRWDALAVGDVIALSPVLFRYVGGALPMVRTEDNQVVSSMDLFQNKQVSSVGCHFSDVSGGTTGYKFFRGLVYNTDSDSAAVSSIPLDFSGTIIGESIKNGESEDYAAFTATGIQTRGRHGIQDSALNPGIEIFCPDVDYKLMAVICRGRTTNTDTSERAST